MTLPQERGKNYLVACPWLVREVFKTLIWKTHYYYDYVMEFTEGR